jgi:hypothetical protein
MKMWFFCDKPHRKHRQVQTDVDSLEPDQRNLVLECATQRAVFWMACIVASPLVAEVAISTWLIVVWPLIGARRVHRPKTQGRVEHSWLSNTALPIEKGHGLTIEVESRNVVETHRAASTELDCTQKRERGRSHVLIELT